MNEEMKLPKNFNIIIINYNPLEIKYTYTYNDESIYEGDVLYCYNLYDFVSELDDFDIKLKELENLNLPNKFSIKFSFHNYGYELYYDCKKIREFNSINDIEEYCLLYMKKSNELDIKNIIDNLNKNKHVSDNILLKIKLNVSTKNI